MPPTPSPSAHHSRGLSLAALSDALGAGLLTVVVPARGVTIDDVTIAEPGHTVYGLPGDLLLGIGVDSAKASVRLIEAAAARGVRAVLLRRTATGHESVAEAARSAQIALGALADHASWAHVVWLLRGVLDRVATGAMAREGTPGSGAGRDAEDLFALADACAALVDAPVTIEDTQSRVLAHSSQQEVADPIRVSTIVGRRVPEAVLRSLRGRGVFRRLARSSEPFYVPGDPEAALLPRLVVPVWAGGEWLGSIWAVVDAKPSPSVIRPLEQTASVVALHLLRLRSHADLARRVLGDRLRAALSGQAADAEEWLPAGPLRVVTLLGYTSESAEQRLDAWESACRRAGWRQPLLAVLDDQVHAVVTDHGQFDSSRGAARPQRSAPGSWEWLEELIATLHAQHPQVRGAAGAPALSPSELDRSRSESLEVARVGPDGTDATDRAAVTLEQAWAAVTCDRAVSGIRTRLFGPAAELQGHDERTGSAYAATVAAWLDHPGDPRAAAAALHVHPNTLRYRLKTARDLLGAETLTDPTARLALRLQLRALGW